MESKAVYRYIYATAESDLNWFFLKKYLWAESITRNDINEYYFTIGFIRHISIIWFLVILFLLGLNSPILWYEPSKIALHMSEYYIGVCISGILAGCSYFSVKHIRDFVISKTSDKIQGLKISYYISIIIYLGLFFVLLAFPLYFIDIPYVFFPIYYMLFHILFATVILLVYLVMRIRNKQYEIDRTVINYIKQKSN